MRNLTMIIVVVFASAGHVHGETLFLNSVQTKGPGTQATVVSHESHRFTEQVATDSRSDRPSGGCQNGSLDQFPGGCRGETGGCCAALWESYCRDKKPCWRPGSPRRHFSGCGFVIPCLSLFHHKTLKGCASAGDCADDATCDCSAIASADGAQTVVPEDATTVPQDVTPQDAAPSKDDLDTAGNSNDGLVQPEVVKEARRFGLPFGWKLPLGRESTPFKTSHPFKRSRPLKVSNPFKTASPFRSTYPSDNSPTAGLKLPFSR